MSNSVFKDQRQNLFDCLCLLQFSFHCPYFFYIFILFFKILVLCLFVKTNKIKTENRVICRINNSINTKTYTEKLFAIKIFTIVNGNKIRKRVGTAWYAVSLGASGHTHINTPNQSACEPTTTVVRRVDVHQFQGHEIALTQHDCEYAFKNYQSRILGIWHDKQQHQQTIK